MPRSRPTGENARRSHFGCCLLHSFPTAGGPPLFHRLVAALLCITAVSCTAENLRDNPRLPLLFACGDGWQARFHIAIDNEGHISGDDVSPGNTATPNAEIAGLCASDRCDFQIGHRENPLSPCPPPPWLECTDADIHDVFLCANHRTSGQVSCAILGELVMDSPGRP